MMMVRPVLLLLAGLLLLACVRSCDASTASQTPQDAEPGNAGPAHKGGGGKCQSLRPQNDVVTTVKGQPITIPHTYLLGNDLTGASPTLGQLSVSSVFSTERRGPRRSAVAVSLSSTSVTFTPRASFVGSVRFTYTVKHRQCCGGLGSRTSYTLPGCSATVTVTVVDATDVGSNVGTKFLDVCNKDEGLGDIYLGASWKPDKGDKDKTPAGVIGIDRTDPDSTDWDWDKPISFGKCVRLLLPDDLNSGRVWVRTGCKTDLPARCPADSQGWSQCNSVQGQVFCDALYSTTTKGGACKNYNDDWFTGEAWCSWDGMCTAEGWPVGFSLPTCNSRPPKTCTNQCGAKQFLCDFNANPTDPKDTLDNALTFLNCKQSSLLCYNNGTPFKADTPKPLSGTPKFRCDTGDSGSKRSAGPGTASPTPGTLYEYTGPLGTTSTPAPDSYDISVVDGFNVAVKLTVVNPAYPAGCSRIGCFTDPGTTTGYQNPAVITCTPQLAKCVEELQIKPGGKAIGCYSLCQAMESPSHPKLVKNTAAQQTLLNLVNGFVTGTSQPWVSLACCKCGGGNNCPTNDPDKGLNLNTYCQQSDPTNSAFVATCTNNPQRCEYGCSPSSTLGRANLNANGPGCDYRLWPTASDGNPYWQQTRRDCRYSYFWQYGECLMPSGVENDYTVPLHNSCGPPATSTDGQGFRLDVVSATAAGVAKL